MSLDALTASWRDARVGSIKRDPTDRGLLQLFDYYAYRGVYSFLQIISKHRHRAGGDAGGIPDLDPTGLPKGSDLDIDGDLLL